MMKILIGATNYLTDYCQRYCFYQRKFSIGKGMTIKMTDLKDSRFIELK